MEPKKAPQRAATSFDDYYQKIKRIESGNTSKHARKPPVKEKPKES
jgi:hypothetical protein